MFTPVEGKTYHLKNAHYEDRFTVVATTPTGFSTDEPFDYDLAEFRKWLDRKGITVTEEVTR